MRRFRSHGDGHFEPSQLAALGENVIIEEGVRVWHPEKVYVGTNVYLGHGTMLKGYHLNRLVIGDDTWVGQGGFLHSAGGLTIGSRVGVGPFVRIITAAHQDLGVDQPLLETPLDYGPVVIEDEAHLGLGAIVLPGVRVGRGAQVGAGAVVTTDVAPQTVVAGNPARLLRHR
jgi:acetyltransferase-like isoleucine patch superfamily enzyme